MNDRSVKDRSIRDASVTDASACAAIYAPYVRDTAISFEAVPPTVEQMAGRISTALSTHSWLILEGNPGGAVGISVLGYAYGGQFKERAAYRWSCEVSVYLRLGYRRTGGGRMLYEALLPRLAARGYRTAFAGMTLPNDASAGLHRTLGFTPSGVFHRVGWKNETWHDVAWWQRDIGNPADSSVGASPPELR